MSKEDKATIIGVLLLVSMVAVSFWGAWYTWSRCEQEQRLCPSSYGLVLYR